MKGLASLLAALGLVGVVFAVLSLLLVILSGSGLASDGWWIVLNLMIGVGLLAGAAAANFDAVRAFTSSGEARRAGKYGSSAIATTVLGIAILGMVGFLGERHHKRFDLSEQKIHSLADQSTKILAALEDDVLVHALVSKAEMPAVRNFFERYDYESDRFEVVYAVPNERPGLLESLGIRPEQLESGGVVHIALGADSVVLTEVTEQAVTNALVKLSSRGERVVYFLEGHGEKAIENDSGDARDGYGIAAESLRNENYRVEGLLLAAAGDVPIDADVVIIAGAARPLLEVENEALERYLARGGSLLVMIDPHVRTDLIDRVASWGVELGDDVVVDRREALFGRAVSPFAARYDVEHPITAEMREPALFHEVRSVVPLPVATDVFTEIVFTGNDSWAERDLARLDQGQAVMEDDDLPGPVPVAVAGTPMISRVDAAAEPPESEDTAAEPPESEDAAAEASESADAAAEVSESEDAAAEASEPRLVVFGDTHFASNEYVDAYRNRDLFVNSVNWLIGDVEAISIRPNVARASSLQITNEQFLTMRWLSFFVLPEAIAVLGVFVWWSRRQASH